MPPRKNGNYMKMAKWQIELGENLIVQDNDGVYITNRGGEVTIFKNIMLARNLVCRSLVDGVHSYSYCNSKNIICRMKVIDLDGTVMK